MPIVKAIAAVSWMRANGSLSSKGLKAKVLGSQVGFNHFQMLFRIRSYILSDCCSKRWLIAQAGSRCRVSSTGLAEAPAALVLGFAVLSVVWLLVAVGLRRQA
ncbi:MAG: hypothetical protein LAO31_11490 [Acidobacteriia bacterium]|nr:hypothetical protein [Terriglobia bacterium]